MCTSSPLRASAVTHSSPMPELPPVTIATRGPDLPPLAVVEVSPAAVPSEVSKFLEALSKPELRQKRRKMLHASRQSGRVVNKMRKPAAPCGFQINSFTSTRRRHARAQPFLQPNLVHLDPNKIDENLKVAALQ